MLHLHIRAGVVVITIITQEVYELRDAPSMKKELIQSGNKLCEKRVCNDPMFWRWLDQDGSCVLPWNCRKLSIRSEGCNMIFWDPYSGRCLLGYDWLLVNPATRISKSMNKKRSLIYWSGMIRQSLGRSWVEFLVWSFIGCTVTLI